MEEAVNCDQNLRYKMLSHHPVVVMKHNSDQNAEFVFMLSRCTDGTGSLDFVSRGYLILYSSHAESPPSKYFPSQSVEGSRVCKVPTRDHV